MRTLSLPASTVRSLLGWSQGPDAVADMVVNRVSPIRRQRPNLRSTMSNDPSYRIRNTVDDRVP